jgi:AraC-like DNA-binding protein
LLGTVQPRTAVLPPAVVANALEHQLLSAILPTEVGQCVLQSEQQRSEPGCSEETVFIYCTAGKGWCELEEERLSIKPGELLVATAGAACRCSPEPDSSLTIHWVHARGRLMGEYLAALGVGSEPVILALGHDARLIGLFGELLDVLAEGCADDDLLCGSSVLQHMIGIFIRARRRKKATAPDAAQRVAASIEFMKSNLTRSLDIAMLSELARVSPSHYSTLFKRQTGYSPVDYLIRLRIQVASELLDNTNYDIKTIAAKLGYKDPLYFSRVFVGVQGVSPSEFRRRVRNSAQASDSPAGVASGVHQLSAELDANLSTGLDPLRGSAQGAIISTQQALEFAQIK